MEIMVGCPMMYVRTGKYLLTHTLSLLLERGGLHNGLGRSLSCRYVCAEPRG